MGLNVLERTREIGVLRAVGASHTSVRKVVVIEGAAVALMSWAFSAALSYPVGRLLSEAVVRTAFGSAAPFRYSTPGLVVWLVVVILIGVAASLAPARSAVRLTVREVLNYE
jgi:putative ABC transport system permease protein